MTTLQKVQLILSVIFLFVIAAKTQDDHDTEIHDDEHDEKYKTILFAILITTFAGCAAFIGGLSIFCIKKEQIAVMPASLAFSSGVIVHLSLINLIPECTEQLHHSTNSSSSLVQFYTLLCVTGGICIALGMEYIFKHCNADPHHHHDHQCEQNPDSIPPSPMVTGCTGTLNTDAMTLGATTKPLKTTDGDVPPAADGTNTSKVVELYADTENIAHVSYSVAFALILHHFPEGIATFISLYHDLEFGALVAFALALHDIPSGICISVPLYCATGSKKKPFYLCAIAAAVYPAGALIGWLILETATEVFIDTFIGVLFGVTGGIMLYIGFVELLPTAIIAANRFSAKKWGNNADCEDDNHRHIMTITISLIFAGLFVMNVSNILLTASGGHDH